MPGLTMRLATLSPTRRFRRCARALPGARAGVLAVMLLATGASAWAANVTVDVREVEGEYRVHGAFTVAVPHATAWDVLADYEHIGAFVTSVRASAFVTGPGGRRVLRQDAIAGAFPFRRSVRVELVLEEQAGRRIAFRDVLARDFLHYAGAWMLGTSSAGTTIEYTLAAEPIAGVPRLLGRGVMSHSARDLLTQVRDEMLRRAAPRPAGSAK